MKKENKFFTIKEKKLDIQILGFTLIELLGVIILLGVLALIVYPVVDSSIKKSREKAYTQTINNILESARTYGTNHKLGYDSDLNILSLDTLKQAGYLENQDIINPINNKTIDGCVIYRWKEDKKQYEYTFETNCVLPTKESCFTYSVLPDNTIEITDYDSNCEKDVIIPNKIDGKSVTKISDYSFSSKNLTSVDLSYAKDLVFISEGAFRNNNISNVNFDNLSDLITVGYASFEQNRISTVDLGDLTSLENIEIRAFKENQISNITIPSSIINIESDSFSNNQIGGELNLSHLTSLENISGFSRNQLTGVILPNNVKNIESGAFSNNQISGELDLSYLISVEYISGFSGNQLTSVILPNNVKSINNYAFEDNQISGELDLSYLISVEYISGFNDNQLTGVILPNNVQGIGITAFSSNQISSITIPNSVINIDYSAFSNNQITNLTIPNSVTDIGEKSFYKSSSSNPNLTKIVNKTNHSFDWGKIINGSYSATDYNFITGTVVNSNGNVEITN